MQFATGRKTKSVAHDYRSHVITSLSEQSSSVFDDIIAVQLGAATLWTRVCVTTVNKNKRFPEPPADEHP